MEPTMNTYDDDVMTLDDAGITIKNYNFPDRPRHIHYRDISHAELISLSFGTGKHQLVGIGPLRPRHFFHWDRKRKTKSHAVSLDLGHWLRVAITPDDAERVFALIRSKTLATQA